MTLVKSLLLGTAAALVASASVQAADLPNAEPTEYVRVCDAYGAGFYYIPGTDTCLRISGYVRAQWNFHESTIASDNWESTDPLAVGALATNNDTFNATARGLVRFDARTRTDMGVLRSFIEFAGGNTNGVAGAANNSGVATRYAFVQFAGVTAGLTDSFFNGDNVPGTLQNDSILADRNVRTTLLAYTASFGNGFSGTLSLEDHAQIDANTFNGAATVGSVDTPDIVANLRVSQGWGNAWLSGAASRVSGFDGAGLNDDEWGWAISAGATLNVDQLAKGDRFFLKGTYADGALNYLYGSSNGINAYNFTALFDTTALGGTGIQKISGWSVVAAFQHFWTPALRSTLFGSYVDLDYDDSTVNTYGPQVVGQLSEAWTVGGNVVWSPVRNLDLGVELFYVDRSVLGGVFAAQTTTSENGFGGIFRVQRSF